MVNKCYFVECCFCYDRKPWYLLYIRFVDRKDRQPNFASFIIYINQFTEHHIWSLCFISDFQCSFLIKKPHLFYEPQLTQHRKKYIPVAQPKTHSLYKFSSKHFSGWCQKTFALHLHGTFSRH